MKVKVKQGVHDHVFDECNNQNIEEYKVYEVIGINSDYYRIINEMGEPILYPTHLFEIVDSTIPESWVRKDYGPDEYYIDPPELSAPGFYEDYFDGDHEAKTIFDKFRGTQRAT